MTDGQPSWSAKTAQAIDWRIREAQALRNDIGYRAPELVFEQLVGIANGFAAIANDLHKLLTDSAEEVN